MSISKVFGSQGNAGSRRGYWRKGILITLAAVNCLAVLFMASMATRALANPPPPPLRKIFFFDDGDVAYRAGTKRTLHQLMKVPNPNLTNVDLKYRYQGYLPLYSYTPGAGHLWQKRQLYEASVNYVTVYKRTNASYPYNTNYPYQMWYQAHSQNKADDKRKQCVVCYAESADGITWIKPNVGHINASSHDTNADIYRAIQSDGSIWQGQYSWSSAAYTTNIPAASNNIVMIGSGGFGTRHWNSVIVEPNEPDTNRRYKMVFTDFEKPTNAIYSPTNANPEGCGTQVAFSPDGIRWTKYPDTNYPIDAIATNTVLDGSYPKNVHRFGYGAVSYTNVAPTSIPTGHPPSTNSHAINPLDYRKAGANHYWGIPHGMSDAQDVFIDPDGATNAAGQPVKKYVIYGKIWTHSPIGEMTFKHAIGRMESTNFINWTNVQMVVTTDDEDDRNTNFFQTGYEKYISTNGGMYTNYTYSATNFLTSGHPYTWDGRNIKFHTTPVFKYEGMYVSLNQLYYQPMYTVVDDGPGELIEAELMASRDGFRWNRFRYNDYKTRVLPRGFHDRIPINNTPTNDPNLTGSHWEFRAVPVVGDPNENDPFNVNNQTRDEFDSKGIIGNSTPIIEDTNIRIYYCGLGTAGVGMAQIPRDRFVGLSAIYPSGTNTIGQVTLKPLNVSGYSDLAVNSVPGAGGEVRVELMTADGFVIPNFAKADATAFTPATPATNNGVSGDLLNRRVRWGTNTLMNLPAQYQTNCVIRIHLKNAEIFSCSLVP